MSLVSRLTRLLGAVAIVFFVLGLAIAALPPARADSTLRVAMHSDLKVIDPVWTTALITTHHGFMIYDTLFALDEKLAIKPQMIDAWSLSDDKLTWTFKLRDGLAWHDGTPVTAEDCVASLKRWAVRDGGDGTLYALAPWPAAWAMADAHKFE